MVTGRCSVWRNCDAQHALCIITMYKLIKLEEKKEKYMHKSISNEDFLNEYKLVDSFCCLVVNFFLVTINIFLVSIHFFLVSIQNLLKVHFMLFSSHFYVLV